MSTTPLPENVSHSRQRNKPLSTSAFHSERRKCLAVMAGCTGLLLTPPLLRAQSAEALPEKSASDRLGALLPQRKLGTSGASITNLGLGGDHATWSTPKQAQQNIEKALEEGIRFFDNAHMYGRGVAEQSYGKFLTPKYRDIAFIMTKTQARDAKGAQSDLEDSLRRMKVDSIDLWQMHALQSPADVLRRIQNGVLDTLLEAQAKGKVKYIGFTGHSSYSAHQRMIAEAQKRGISFDAAQMPVNPADPHFDSFVLNVLPQCVAAGIGVLGMKSLAWGRFFGGNRGWRRMDASVEPVVPARLSLEEVFGFVWSLPVSSLISGMESAEHISQNAALARKSWQWDEAQRQRRVDAVADIAGPELEFYKN